MKQIFRSGLALLLLIALLALSGCGSEERAASATGKDARLTLAAVGDIYLSDEMLEAARLPDGSYDFLTMLSGSFSAISDADISVGNFEGTFSGPPYGKATGSYPDELAGILKNAGFDLLQTANSYSINAGMTGLTRTKSVIEAQGMLSYGTFTDSDDRAQNLVRVMEVNGIRVAFIAFTKSLNGLALPAGTESAVQLLYTDYMTNFNHIDTDGIVATIKAAKKENPDVIVASVHWGSENIKDITTSQNNIADLMFRNGVDVILGTHSHIVSAVERRSVTTDDGKRKDVVLAYCLGDFCEVQPGECNSAPVLKLTFFKDGFTGETTIEDVSFTPVVSVDMGEDAPMRYIMLNVADSIRLYENNYYDSVTRTLYETLQSRWDYLSERTGLPKE